MYFSLTAEHLLPLLSASLSLVFLLFVPSRLSKLRRSTVKVRSGWALRWKIVSASPLDTGAGGEPWSDTRQ